jgi:hypothetical protein
MCCWGVKSYGKCEVLHTSHLWSRAEWAASRDGRVSPPRARISAIRWALLIALGIAGAIAAHAIGYRLAHTDAHGRHLALMASGHAYWPFAIQFAVFGGLVALLGHILLGAFRAHVSFQTTEALTLGAVFVRLSGIQVGTFLALEVGERLIAGSGLPWGEVALWVGIPIQVLVAAVGALVLTRAENLGARLGHAHRLPEPRRAFEALIPAGDQGLACREPRGELSARAPPRIRSA